MMAKPIRALEFLYPMIQFFIVAVAVYYAPPPPPSQDSTTLAALVVVLGLVLKVLYNLKRKWTVTTGNSCITWELKSLLTITLVTGAYLGGSWGVRDPPLGRPSFEQTTYNIQVVKMPWQYLGRKSHCWKAHFFKICFFVKYFRQRLLSLVNMGLHATIIRLSPLIHEGEQRYKPYIGGNPRMVSLLWPPRPFEKSWLRPC